jgi:Phytanoyl-CoA dioxygenase (PhyH)
VHFELQQIRSHNELPTQSARQLIDSGFVIIPGPFSGDRLTELAADYDGMMALASGPDFKMASTTTRMSDVLNYGSMFDDIFLWPPLHEACAQAINEPFKLSSFLARTLKPNAIAQDLHADLMRSSEDAPLVGFILMIDAFREDNGATRFVPFSHKWPDLPSDRLTDTKGSYPGEALGCGESGSIIIFNGGIWHGHTANVTPNPRRSIQGYFVRRNARSGTDFTRCLLPLTQARMGPSARYLLGLD